MSIISDNFIETEGEYSVPVTPILVGYGLQIKSVVVMQAGRVYDGR